MLPSSQHVSNLPVYEACARGRQLLLPGRCRVCSPNSKASSGPLCMCRLHPEAEVAKSAMRIGHQLLCGFDQHCSAAAVQLVSSSLPHAQAGPQQQHERQESASEQSEIGQRASAADAAVVESHADLVTGNGLAALHHMAAVRLLGEAAIQKPASVAAEVWDALWPCLGPAGKASAAYICGKI